MTDESLLLDIDIIEMKYEKLLAEKEAALAESNLEIARLKAELEKLQ